MAKDTKLTPEERKERQRANRAALRQKRKELGSAGIAKTSPSPEGHAALTAPRSTVGSNVDAKHVTKMPDRSGNSTTPVNGSDS